MSIRPARGPRAVLNAVERSLYAQLLEGICEEMGIVLQRGAFSPNIKERRDFSTAIYDDQARLVAQGRNIPVHLGSMFSAVHAALQACGQLADGDVVLLNDPFHGGTHLPDLTVIAPYYAKSNTPGSRRSPLCYFAVRAHHSDIGGMAGGSLGHATDIYQEGLVIPPLRIQKAGLAQEDTLALLYANSRTPHERRGDLAAQLGALRRGAGRLDELLASSTLSISTFRKACSGLQQYCAEAAREFLHELDGKGASSIAVLEGVHAAVPDRPASASRNAAKGNQSVKSPGSPRICVRLSISSGVLTADFSGSSGQCDGPFNAVLAITTAAVFYSLRCLMDAETPTNHGLLTCVRVLAPERSIVNAGHPAAVNAANVETSQVLVEVLLRAWAKLLPGRVAASSQGTMNNLLISGFDPRPGAACGRAFTYYETIAGGHGGHPDGPGLSGRHSHMTNTLNTPVEALEHSYPLLVRQYALRRGSGGAGRFQGGAGVVREIELLSDATVTIVSQHRETGPQGLCGGQPGMPGSNRLWQKPAPAGGRQAINLPATFTKNCKAGDRVVVQTPGGGGWGRKRR